MNNIVWFSEWKNVSHHTFPQVAPFKEVSFSDIQTREKADAFVQSNIRHPYHVKNEYKEPLYLYIEKTKKPKIVIESAVFRQNPTNQVKEKYFRFGWESFLYNEANFGPRPAPSDRWERIQKEQEIVIRPWRQTRGKYVLIFLQHAIDTSLFRLIEQFGSYYKWLTFTIDRIRENTDLPIVIRPHPKHGMYMQFFDAYKMLDVPKIYDNVSFSVNQGQEGLSGGKYLERDLEDAHTVVGWTSNALTEAVCYGIPAFCMSAGAMAWPVSVEDTDYWSEQKYDFSSIDNIQSSLPDRTQWLYNLSYCQWTREEIRDGIAWNHIRQSREV